MLMDALRGLSGSNAPVWAVYTVGDGDVCVGGRSASETK